MKRFIQLACATRKWMRASDVRLGYVPRLSCERSRVLRKCVYRSMQMLGWSA